MIRIEIESKDIQYIPRNMHTVFALLCFVVVIHWLIFPYPSGLLHWHCGNLTIAPVPAKQPWWIWINTSCEFIMNDCITTTKQSTTKPCAYFLGYTVSYNENWGKLALLLRRNPSGIRRWDGYSIGLDAIITSRLLTIGGRKQGYIIVPEQLCKVKQCQRIPARIKPAYVSAGQSDVTKAFGQDIYKDAYSYINTHCTSLNEGKSIRICISVHCNKLLKVDLG